MDASYAVYEYSRRGDLAGLREALQEPGAKPDGYLAYDGSTALVMALRGGHGAVARELLANGADATVRTEEGSTVLHHAVSGGSAEAVAAVLQAGVDVNEPNEDGVVPLMLAAHYGRVEVVRLLCEHGADLSLSADGWGTALDCATGAAEAYLESKGAARTAAGQDQPLAAASERFSYGCFESGESLNAAAQGLAAAKAASTSAGTAVAAAAGSRPRVGDSVVLRAPKSGVLKPGDVGTVVMDDGSDCLPLKVQFGDRHDYYDCQDLVVCAAPIQLPPDGDRASPEGTKRYLSSKLDRSLAPSELGRSGLFISPVGFGCHRLEDCDQQRAALELAIAMGCNLVDLAPNYTDGAAERVAGSVLHELIGAKKVRRDELVIATKVGNVLGGQLAHVSGVPDVVRINDNLCHCISPQWIEQELTRSLERLQLTCVDCLLLHCPEYQVKGGVEMAQVYSRLQAAFRHLEAEVARGRIAMYGVSAAFHPLRPTDPEHLDLTTVLAQLPQDHHFRVIQFPLNYAEAELLWVGHAPRNPDGSAVDKERVLDAPTLFELAKANGLATWTNRPLDGIWKESHGVLRFSSLDCDVRSFSELQLDNCDALEEKITTMCKLSAAPFKAGEGASGELAAKTVKVLASLKDVDCVLLGMRRPPYVVGTLPLAFGTPALDPEVALSAVRAVHNTVSMWYATSIHEADHGTAKDWRLPMDQRFSATSERALAA